MAKRTAEFVFVGNAADLIKAARESEAAIDKTAKSTKHASNEMDKLGKQSSISARLTSKGYNSIRLGATGALAAVGGLAFGLKDSIKIASDVNESLTKNQQIFGQYAKGIEDFSNRSAASFGISKTSALDYISVFGNLVRTQGLSQKSSAGLSTRLTKLAADLASFNNTGIDTALEALRSGLTGQPEPLRKFGVALSVAAVQAEAVRAGILKADKASADYGVRVAQLNKAEVARAVAIKQYGANSLQALDTSAKLAKAQEQLAKTTSGASRELTPQQKILARTSLIFRETQLAQGDFAKTSKDLANQTRILQAQFSDAKGELGTQLLPTLVKGANALTKFTKGMRDGSGAGGKFADTVREVYGDLKPVLGAFGSLAKFLAAHPKLIVTAIGAWGLYKAAVAAATIGTKAKLAAAFFGLGPKAAVAGTEAGAAFGGAASTAATGALAKGKWVALGTSIGGAIAAGVAGVFGANFFGDLIDNLIPDKKYTLGLFGKTPGGGKVSGKGTTGALSGFSGAFSKKYPVGADVTDVAIGAAQKYGASPLITKALIEAGIVESGLRNLNYGDRDSVGFLQQRPSQGWKGLMDPEKAAAEFIAKAKKAYRPGMSAGQLAQAVQRSAFPGRYDAVGSRAEAILAGAGITGGGGGGAGGGSNPYTASALADLAATQREKAAAAREKAEQKAHDARVKRHEREERAASRAFNAITRRYSPDRDIRLANLRGTAVDKGDDAYGRLQARQDLSTEDVTTIGGRDKRKSELAALAKAKAVQLKREKQELAHYQAAAKKLQQIIRAGTKQLSKTKGPARAKIRDRLQGVKDRLTDINGSILALNGNIEDSQVELEQLGVESAQVDADFAAAQPTLDDIVGAELSKIDAHQRAGDLTPQEAAQTKINLLTQAVNGQFGGMNEDQLLGYRADLGDAQRDLQAVLEDNADKIKENTAAADDNTSALRDVKASIDAQLHFADRVSAVTSMQAVRMMGDVLTGEVGRRVVARGYLPGSGERSRL